MHANDDNPTQTGDQAVPAAASAGLSPAVSGKELRRLAEEHAGRMHAPELGALTSEEGGRLLHELRVHQIELEMQNEELRRAQEALETQRARYFDLYDLAPVGYVTVGETGLILEANLTAAALLGRPRNALVGQLLTRFVRPEHQNAYYHHRKLLFDTGAPQVCELRLARRDGSAFWARLDASLARDEASGATVSRVTLSDIDDRKQAWEILRESEERFRTLVASMDEIVFTLDTAQRHTAVYGPWLARASLASASFLGKTAREIFGEPGARAHEEANRRALRGENVVYEWTSDANGQARHYETSLVPMHDGQGRIVGLVGVGRDVTQRRQAEDSLRESEERHRTIAEMTSDYVYAGTVHPDGRAETEWISGAVERITGYTSEEIKSMPGGFSSLLLAEDLRKVISLQPCMRADGFLDVEYRIRAKTGEIRWLRDTMKADQSDATAPAMKLVGAVQDITERKLAQLALQRNEDNLRALMNAISESVLLIEPDGTVVIANAVTARRLNTAAAQLEGRRIYDFLEPEVASQRSKHVEQVIASGQPASFEDVRNARHIFNSVAPVFDAQGRVARLAIFGFDITERVLAEEELRRSQQSLARAQRVGHLGSWAWDLSRQDLAWSDELYRIFGLGRDFQLSFEAIDAMLHPDDRAFNDETVRGMLAAGDGAEYEFRIVRPDGEIRHLNQSIEITRDETGAPNQMFGIMQDITERKRADARLRQSEADLRKAQQIANVGNWTWHIRSNRLEWSDQMHRIFGIVPAGFTGDLADVVARAIHPDDRAAVEKANASVSLGKQTVPMEYRVVWSDGTIRTVWAEPGELILNEAGVPERLTGVVQDITERKQAEEAIHRLNAELEQRVHDRTAQLEASNKELEAFAYSVSHDLRAPLRAMDGFSAILLAEKSEQLDEEGQQFLHRIQQASRRMGQLIDDLLNLSRIARRDMTRQPVDLSAMASQIATELQQSAPLRQVEFVIPPGIVVDGDAHLLRIVLDNLLGNAWKFTGPRAQARIELGAIDQEGQRAVCVRDNGVGFDMTYADKLFKPFQRLHGMNDFPGTGIGLATIQRIIARHGGRVWAEAAVDQGAVFYFTVGRG